MNNRKVYTAIGLMSGTSLDGVDCALIETDGHGYVKPLAFVTAPYTDAERAVIRACFGMKERSVPKIKEAEALLTRKHIDAIKQIGGKADLIGFHGQTIYHAPEDGLTVQIGDAAMMAKAAGIDVVADFRSADVKAGGEGAPLAPLYHAARVKGANMPLPAVILNIGGVANVTYIDEETILAFDCGSGNALLDDWILSRTGERFDEDGKIAAAGKVRGEYLEVWLAHDYFMRPPPKSLDRDQWNVAKDIEALGTEDGAATLLAFTVQSTARAMGHMPRVPKAWYVCGGGRHNKALMNALNDNLGGCVRSVEDLGWNGDATEAECFAYLAVRSVLGLPISLPSTTGVPAPMTGGVIVTAC